MRDHWQQMQTYSNTLKDYSGTNGFDCGWKQDGLAQPGVRLQGYNLTTGVAPGPSPPHPSPGPPVPPAPPFNGTVIPNYNIVRQQCDACGQSATGCCIKGQPNLHVQYLSHKRAPSLNACAELCRSCTGCARSQSGSGTAGRCHSFVWNSKNYDCFGRLDSLFDEHNPFYSGSPGLFSGSFENESVATPTTAMAPGATSGKAQMCSSVRQTWGNIIGRCVVFRERLNYKCMGEEALKR